MVEVWNLKLLSPKLTIKSFATVYIFIYTGIIFPSHRSDTANSNTVNSKFHLIADSLESAYSLNLGAQEIWGKGGGDTLALLW